ncbi:MAG: hypothetical protein OQK75_08145 [Gammaproteobacteria bacterium]|nr:hypothetical protein [Gammaproteobacteria bacterium]MCW8987627.1 hypothetical protein [Gammaproteobacteria bacterium]MCW9029922.1 hypothetical protein [Gammaproteobacteria bacterium]
MTMNFSPAPGPNERHLKRRLLNPLFPKPEQDITQQDIDDAQRKDEENLLSFMSYFQSVVQKTTELGLNSESDVVLEIKEQLDECYAISCAMPGDHSNLKIAIKKLIAAIMAAIRKGAADDPVALKKLDEEDVAREMHNELHEIKLIADLMLENSPILEKELTPTLLNEDTQDLDAALQLFSAEQLDLIVKDAQKLLEHVRNEGHEIPHAWERFQQIKHALNTNTPQ